MAKNQVFTLANEFAEVRVEWGGGGSSDLRITDLGSGAIVLLDARQAIRAPADDPVKAAANRKIDVGIDHGANGPRLKIADAETDLTIYLDPLQLADAAAAGEWAKLPPAYDMQS